MQGSTDSELIAAIGRADQPAQEEFFMRYRQKAYRVAYRLLGNEADASDAAADSFVKAFAAAAGFRGESSVKTWFYRIVVNTSLDLRRRRKRNVSMDAGDEEASLADSIPAKAENPFDAAERSEISVKIADAVASLSEKHRAVFVLAVVEELSYREIADTLGISIGTVMSRLFYARKYLQESLSGYLEA